MEEDIHELTCCRHKYHIYSIRRRGVYSIQALGRGRRLLEGGVLSHWTVAFIGGQRLFTQQIRSLAVRSTVSLCHLLQLSRCSQALIYLLSW